MLKVALRDTERSCEILVQLDIHMESETMIPLSMVTKEYLEKEIDMLKYNLLELAAKQIMNERKELKI